MAVNKSTNGEENQELKFHVSEAAHEMEELLTANRMGNIPRLGAALCHLEFHISSALKLLERKHPYFKASEFTKIIAQRHQC